MKIVIDIDEGIAQGIIDGKNDEPRNIVRAFQATIADAIKNGTPLPKNHGDLIDKEKLKGNINGWYAFMKDICKQPHMTLKQEEIIGKIDMMAPIIEADKEGEE